MNDLKLAQLQSSWAKHLYARLLHFGGHIRETDVPPSPMEARKADIALQCALRPAVFGELGGFRPEETNRHTSWWGGCFLGAPGESIPIGRSGKPMHPLLQVRTDEIDILVPGIENYALLTLWIDLDGNLFEPVAGMDFSVFTHQTLEDLVPLGVGYRESEILPTFPICWQKAVDQQPSWQDFAFKVPSRVAWSDTSEWFGNNPIVRRDYELKSSCPVKLGGWPTWIQGSQWETTEDDEDFVLQVDTTPKGRVGFGDSGSIYLFRQKRSGNWLLRCDFF
ncbi:MAG: DUF1963 domain-containing protein [Pseudomonadota bacterium]